MAGGSPVAMLRCSSSVPPPDKPATLGREARMDTVFFHFKVSRGAAGTHRAFVQQPRVPSRPGTQPAVILLKICVWFGEVVPGGGKPTLIRAGKCHRNTLSCFKAGPAQPPSPSPLLQPSIPLLGVQLQLSLPAQGDLAAGLASHGISARHGVGAV